MSDMQLGTENRSIISGNKGINDSAGSESIVDKSGSWCIGNNLGNFSIHNCSIVSSTGNDEKGEPNAVA